MQQKFTYPRYFLYSALSGKLCKLIYPNFAAFALIAILIFITSRTSAQCALSSPLVDTACSNVLFNYTPASDSAVTFNWTRAAVAGISNPGASGGGIIS